jgi:peptidoglycan/xylan/chitin deacetylase (PgdA/CDA1 family)
VPARHLLVKQAAVAADAVLPRREGLVVLLYHRVGGPGGGEVDLAPSVFADQVAWLADSGRVLSLEDALAWLRGERTAPARPVVLTFDDGTPDLVEHAVGVLARHDVPATLYLATEHVEQGRSFWDDGTVLSWAALADALTTGVLSIGSHTHSHALLDRLAPDAAADELDRSVGLIEERLGVTALDFAYPKALPPSPAVDALVRARFRSAALAGGRVNRVGTTDVHRLARTPVQRSDRPDWFRRKADGGLRLEGLLREVASRRRYAGAQR